MIAAIPLLEELDESPAKEPFVREITGAAVGVVFFEAGRFDESELAQGVHHALKALAKVSEESLRKSLLSHNEEMVAMQSARGNSPANEAVKQPERCDEDRL